ncbi:MAG: hypothetical protein Q4F44_08640 [Bacteroidales bacterium]|nr:hypothetical protein [Bacteroidales bacterium]
MNFRTLFLLFSVSCLSLSCNDKAESVDTAMTGAWMLKSVIYPTGYTVSYPNSRGYTRCKIYDSDSSFYHVELLSVSSETMIVPLEMERYTFIKDAADTLLVENGRFMLHFQLSGDTTYTVFNNLEQELWVKVNDMSASRMDEIKSIVKNNIDSCEDDVRSFVFSTSEKRLKRVNRSMFYVTVVLALLALLLLMYIYRVIKRNRAIRRELQLINEQNALMPQPVVQAMRMVEQEFFSSEYYRGLRARIESGELMRHDEWSAIEQNIKPVYPNFISRLYNLHNLSTHEYQVCLLLKLNIPPTLIAKVLCKEVSSISSTRSRLYSKVFGQKGSSRDWDAFIATL